MITSPSLPGFPGHALYPGGEEIAGRVVEIHQHLPRDHLHVGPGGGLQQAGPTAGLEQGGQGPVEAGGPDRALHGGDVRQPGREHGERQPDPVGPGLDERLVEPPDQIGWLRCGWHRIQCGEDSVDPPTDGLPPNAVIAMYQVTQGGRLGPPPVCQGWCLVAPTG